ncbi:unnamed protein product [Paramecium pentaurelia]|uniref:Uncharacterized protein n=1 Tax=Paramecium pentaurelia TaxID=43138 RepID=A0A8S1SZB7_9CILI|nr:unnamed protein product [Paramecium pentaurelia]CAD8144066.1 unnamed protein product [Paramecium pentaurelia]
MECDNLINGLNTYIDNLNQSFSLSEMVIRYKYSLQNERLVHLISFQINYYLHSTIKFIGYKQSITKIISEQASKLTYTFNNVYQYLLLSQFHYYQIDDI